MQGSGAHNIGFTPANASGNTGTIAAKSLPLITPVLTLGCGAASELNRLFSIVIFSAPLCGGEIVRVEVQNVGNFLLRKP
jgi:hypothetical protein